VVDRPGSSVELWSLIPGQAWDATGGQEVKAAKHLGEVLLDRDRETYAVHREPCADGGGTGTPRLGVGQQGGEEEGPGPLQTRRVPAVGRRQGTRGIAIGGS